LDVLIASTGDLKTPHVLEHFLATGNVIIKSARGNNGIDDAAKPDGIAAKRLELLTSLPAGSKIPAPAQLLADGDVVAWTYTDQKNGGESKRLARQTIYTPKLDVTLEPKDHLPATATANTPTNLAMGGGTNVRTMTATDGVKVELEGFGNQTVI